MLGTAVAGDFAHPTVKEANNQRLTMLYRNLLFTGVFAAVLATSTTAQAFDDAKYPDLSGQWVAVRMPGVTGQPAFDPTKPWGRGQQAPLTPEYQKVLNCGSGDRRSAQLAHR